MSFALIGVSRGPGLRVGKPCRSVSFGEAQAPELAEKIRRAFAENFSVHGARKVWLLLRGGEDAVRRMIERLMLGRAYGE